VVATFGVTLLVFREIVIPTQTASLQNEVADLRKQASFAANVAGEKDGAIRQLQERISLLEKELKNTQSKLAAAQLTNLFEFGNPYPIGLGNIRVGNTRDRISQVYADSSIERTAGFWSVKMEHAAWSSVTYYFARVDGELLIYQILFFFRRDATPETLLQKLTEALGHPTTPGTKPNCYVWSLKKPQELFVTLEADRRAVSFLLGVRKPTCNTPE